MSTNGVIATLGVLASSMAGVFVLAAILGASNNLNSNSAVQNLPVSQQSTLYTLEAHGGAAISMDPTGLLEAMVVVLVSLGAVFSHSRLKNS